jgi:hypothetical protein
MLSDVIAINITFHRPLLTMLKVQTLAIALCVFALAGLAMYSLDLLNVPGTDDLIQQVDAIRRSTHQCIWPGC